MYHTSRPVYLYILSFGYVAIPYLQIRRLLYPVCVSSHGPLVI